MDFAWSPADIAFKEELEAFLDKEMPPFIEQWSDNEDMDASRGVMGVMDKRKAWQNKLNEGRWAAILWPEEWGGRAATTAQQVIYTQVMAKYRATGIFNANGIVDTDAADNDTVLRYQAQFNGTDTITTVNATNNYVTFNRDGFAIQLNTTAANHLTFLLHTTPTITQWTRCLEVTLAGQMTTERSGTGLCT